MDEWVIMPNHIHLIIILQDYDFDNAISSIGATPYLTTTKIIRQLYNMKNNTRKQNIVFKKAYK